MLKLVCLVEVSQLILILNVFVGLYWCSFFYLLLCFVTSHPPSPAPAASSRGIHPLDTMQWQCCKCLQFTPPVSPPPAPPCPGLVTARHNPDICSVMIRAGKRTFAEISQKPLWMKVPTSRHEIETLTQNYNRQMALRHYANIANKTALLLLSLHSNLSI